MKALDRSFTQIINGTTQFVIPVFQRDYTWTEDQCRQLWSDVLRAAEKESGRGHFMGSIVYVDTGDSMAAFTRWLVIDGQQRLTTLTLLLAALRDRISKTGWHGNGDSPTVDRINSYFLINPLESGDRHRKLVLRRADDSTLDYLITGSKAPVDLSEPILNAYRLFSKLVASNDPDAIYQGIAKLIVVDVTLHHAVDNPQLVFESLNSTGVDLSQADLVRNYILMSLPEKEQTTLYDGYWSIIEGYFKGSGAQLDSFVRDYVAQETRITKQTRYDQIYRVFREHFSYQSVEDWKNVLEGMTPTARYYAAFTLGRNVEGRVAEALRNIRNLGEVAAILVTKLYNSFNGLDERGFLESLSLVESYLFRRAICGFQTRSYWSVLARIALVLQEDNPLESLQVALTRQQGSYRFPSDDEFRRALVDGDLYGLRACRHLLERLENDGSKEYSDTSNYSIEHILPQNESLRTEWQEMLGNEWKQVQRDWLHRLGNLTLTGYNSTYSDRPFDEKKSMPGGFSESAVRLNRFVREQPVWTAEQIRERGECLANQALKIWPALKVEQEVIDEAIRREMEARARTKDIEQVEMDSDAKRLFQMLRDQVLELDDIIEVPEGKSVSYHAPHFFLEVLPRTGYLTLLLSPNYGAIDDPTGFIKDASEWKFLVGSKHDGGLIAHLEGEADVDTVMPFVHQAFAMQQE